MLQKASASSERGSMLPLFLGLLTLGLVLAIGAAEICAVYTLRESLQQHADQTALVAANQGLQTAADLISKVRSLTESARLENFRLVDGKTAEVQLCADWQGWLKLPGLNSKQVLCAWSAAR